MLRPAFYLILFIFAQVTAAEVTALSAGLGVEGRLQKEVNPDYVEGKTVGMVFGQVLFNRWGVQPEFGFETHTSKTGAMSITSKTYNFGAWGRYIFVNENRWQPFLTLGLGANFDTVTSKFATASDERSGIRYFGGTGVGLSAVYLKYLLLEGEGRVAGVQDRKEPMVSALFRVGFIY